MDDELLTKMEPKYAFSIPSIHDDTPLDCRLYYEVSYLRGSTKANSPVKGAVIAHPYAPLGGSYDDRVVLSVAETLVNLGYVVGTFNFR